MTEWFTAAELAAARLPGLPQTKRRMNAHATASGWHGARSPAGERLARRRAAKGAGFEFHISLMPAPARSRLEARAATARPGAVIPKHALPAASGGHSRLDARLFILDRAADWRRAHGHMTLAEADDSFSRQALAPTSDVPDWVRASVRKLSSRTLQDWRARRVQGRLDLVAGLHGQRRGAHAVAQIGDGALADLIGGHIVSNPFASAMQLRKLAEHRFPDSAIPNLRSFQRFIARFRDDHSSSLLAITNPDRFKSHRRLTGSNSYRDITRLNQMWEIDASPADALCIDGRHTIYALIDIWSRRLLTLVTRTPRTEASLALIRRGILDWGVPDIIKTDNGSDFTSQRFVRAVISTGVEHWTTEPFSPEQKGCVERAIGTIQRGFMRMVPGFIGHDVADRQMIESRRAFAARLGESDDRIFCVEVTAAQLQGLLDRFTAGDYASSPHEGLGGMTPAAKAVSWLGSVKIISNPRALDLLLAEQGFRQVTKQGIRLDHGLYIAGALEPGTRVMVRMDPRDMGHIHVFAENGIDWICEAVCPDRAGVDPRETVAMAQAERHRIVKDGKAYLRGLARAVRPHDMIEAVLARGEAQAGLLPAPNHAREVHWTPALEGAAAAVAGERPRSAAASQPAGNVVVLPESPKQRFARALAIRARMDGGADVDAAEARWLGGYETTAEFKASAMVFETSGPQWLEA